MDGLINKNEQTPLGKYSGYITLIAFAVFILWLVRPFADEVNENDSNADSNETESKFTLFPYSSATRLTWMQVKGKSDGNESSLLGVLIPNDKVLARSYYGYMSEPNSTSSNILKEHLLGVGDEVVFSNIKDMHSTIKIQKILFSNKLGYIVVEGVDANGTKTHFYVSSEPQEL